MFKWGLLPTPHCDCGHQKQTVSHIVGECPKRRYTGEMENFARVLAGAMEWLSDLDIQL